MSVNYLGSTILEISKVEVTNTSRRPIHRYNVLWVWPSCDHIRGRTCELGTEDERLQLQSTGELTITKIRIFLPGLIIRQGPHHLAVNVIQTIASPALTRASFSISIESKRTMLPSGATLVLISSINSFLLCLCSISLSESGTVILRMFLHQ
jgi:hypothetical protein